MDPHPHVAHRVVKTVEMIPWTYGWIGGWTNLDDIRVVEVVEESRDVGVLRETNKRVGVATTLTHMEGE